MCLEWALTVGQGPRWLGGPRQSYLIKLVAILNILTDTPLHRLPRTGTRPSSIARPQWSAR